MSDKTNDSGTSGAGAAVPPAPAGSAAELAERQRVQAEQDEQDRQAREAQARQDAADDAVARAQEAARRAAEAADVAQTRAEQLQDGQVEIDVPQPGVTIRTTARGVQHFRPGRQFVPVELANALGNAPTFATSGDGLADTAVRRTLERAGVQELATTEDTTAKHTSMLGDEDEEGTNAELRTGDSGSGRRRTRPDHSEPKGATVTELRELGAEKVKAKYDRAVRAGRVRPIADGKGSGADGRVVTDDMVQALYEAGEKA